MVQWPWNIVLLSGTWWYRQLDHWGSWHQPATTLGPLHKSQNWHHLTNCASEIDVNWCGLHHWICTVCWTCQDWNISRCPTRLLCSYRRAWHHHWQTLRTPQLWDVLYEWYGCPPDHLCWWCIGTNKQQSTLLFIDCNWLPTIPSASDVHSEGSPTGWHP